MGPHSPQSPPPDLFRARLDEQINMKHPLVRLAGLIDWDEIHRGFAGHFNSGRGRPALSPRLVAGLLYLQHAFDASDEAVVGTWVENPYWQFFTGEVYLQTELPIDPSSLTRWRKRIGEEGVETLLALTIEAARKAGMISKTSVDRVIVDTTVMPKAIAHPTDSRLLERAREHMVKLASEGGIALRQNDNREAPRLATQVGRYAHAKQYKRMRKTLRTLRGRVGRVHREIERKVGDLPDAMQDKARELLQRAARILTQRTKDKNKLYALHAPPSATAWIDRSKRSISSSSDRVDRLFCDIADSFKARPWDTATTPLQLALARGHRWLAMLESGEAKSLKEIAAREGIDNSYVSRMVNLTTLAPDIVAAILDDAMPNHITLFDLAVDPPALWDEQRARGGL